MLHSIDNPYHLAVMSNMLTQPQLRILKWLNEYPSSLEKSWDVSRDLSLPGIAEGIGVVRSALNIPLRIIEEHGFVFKRMAHVIGGGSRRRQRSEEHTSELQSH